MHGLHPLRSLRHAGLLAIAAALAVAACGRETDHAADATRTTSAVLVSAPPTAPSATTPSADSDDHAPPPAPLVIAPEPTLDRGAGETTWATRGPQGGTVSDVGAAYPLPSAASLRDRMTVVSVRPRDPAPAPPTQPFFESSFGAPPPNDPESSFGPDAGF